MNKYKVVKVKIPSTKNKIVTLSMSEFDEMFRALRSMVEWDTGGIYGDGEEIIDKVGLNRAKRVIEKLLA